MESNEPEQTFHWHYIELDDRNFQTRGRSFLFAIVLFSIVVLITLLLLYARWVRRFRHLHSHAPPSQPQGLDPSTINSISTILHQSSPAKTADQSECCICLGLFQDGEKVKVLPNCRHCYHSECVDQWLSSQPSCPLCRSSLRVHSPV